MKKLFTLLLLILTVASMLLAVSCGKSDESSSQDTTDGTADSTAGDTSADSTVDSTADDTSTTDSTTETPTTDPSSGEFVEAEHIQKTDDAVTITSLKNDLVMTIKKATDGKIVYTLTAKDGTLVIDESEMGIEATNFAGFSGASFTAATAKRLTVTYPYMGTFSEMTDDCVAATVSLENEGEAFAIEVKLYDGGVAFRYNIPDATSSRSVRNELTSFKVNNLLKVWCGKGSDCYESQIMSYGYSSLGSDKLNGPLMIQLSANKGYVSILEGFVDSTYIGTNFISTGSDNTIKVAASWNASKEFDAFTAANEIKTGWRVINYSQDLGDIVTSNIIYHTALGIEGKASAYENTDWIVPGKSVWSWINDRGVPFEPQIEYTLNAARLGFTYNIIDEGYPSWESYEERLLELGLLADDLGVKQILWCYVTPYHNGWQINSSASAKNIMKKLVEYHMSGIKLDFFNSESTKMTHTIQKATLEAAMENEIIVNFHGIHKPTSYAVLYPSELTREGIRGLENMERSDIVNQARFFTSQYYTRLLSGHADFTPDVNTAMQIASLVVLDSPLMVIATDPVNMFANPALEMIRAIPTVWDRTVFLDGTIGSYVSVAKELNGVWYIGGISSNVKKDVKVDLSKILGEGEYQLTYWKDNSTTSKEKFVQTVTKDSVIDIGNLSAGCGYVMQITKLSMSQYGGEIKNPITVTASSADAVVKYTIDGSDPMTSSTAITYTDAITLSDTCKLRVAIVEGDGKGTELSYQFSKVQYNSVKGETAFEDGKTVLTLTETLDGAKIYYTTDGSTPTTASTLYTAPIQVTKATTVKAIAVAKDGKTSAVKQFSLTVTTFIQSVKPDVYLGVNYKEAVAGWDNRIFVNKSMNDTVLSLGGGSATSGTKFEHGLSTNAIGYFVYDIPENATEFVGVAGIDDSVYNNAADGHKASIICTIYIDNTAVYTTKRLARGEFEQIRVAIPEGAKEIKIHFGDAGDGITCDNADICDAGFILAD